MTVYIGLSIIHVFVFSWLIIYWRKTPQAKSIATSDLQVSVIIPIRNESHNIAKLILQLNEQDYPRDRFEVIVVDDNSEDNSGAIVQSLSSRVDYKLIYLLSSERKGKKAAITKGVNHSNYEIILTTDGDCQIGKSWIKSHASSYIDKDVMMLAGPVIMVGNGLFSYLQSIEFASLTGVAMATLRAGKPLTCNGANMSYRKEEFLEVNGYEGNEHIASGDDEFLLQKIGKRHSEGIYFLKNTLSIVKTPAKETLVQLLNQRLRWSSKWKYHESLFPKLIAIFFFLDLVIYFILTLVLLVSDARIELMLAAVLSRLAIESLFILFVVRFYQLNVVKSMLVGSILHIIYPVFVAFLGIASIFGSYSWKGRKY